MRSKKQRFQKIREWRQKGTVSGMVIQLHTMMDSGMVTPDELDHVSRARLLLLQVEHNYDKNTDILKSSL